MASINASSITESQLAAFRAEFDRYDFDKDGLISATDVRNVMDAIGYHPSDQWLQSNMAEVQPSVGARGGGEAAGGPSAPTPCALDGSAVTGSAGAIDFPTLSQLLLQSRDADSEQAPPHTHSAQPPAHTHTPREPGRVPTI